MEPSLGFAKVLTLLVGDGAGMTLMLSWLYSKGALLSVAVSRGLVGLVWGGTVGGTAGWATAGKWW